MIKINFKASYDFGFPPIIKQDNRDKTITMSHVAACGQVRALRLQKHTHTYPLEFWVGVQLDACAIPEWLRRFLCCRAPPCLVAPPAVCSEWSAAQLHRTAGVGN